MNPPRLVADFQIPGPAPAEESVVKFNNNNDNDINDQDIAIITIDTSTKRPHYLDVLFGLSRIADAFLFVNNYSLGRRFSVVVNLFLRNGRLDLCHERKHNFLNKDALRSI